jgi:CheY-like chemotaxis protein
VDDESSIRELGQKRLTMLGHNTDIAGNGEEALELMKNNRYDLIITDIGMPVMNGWQLTERVRAEYGDTLPIAILSGGGDDQVNDENDRGKADYFLRKPIEMSDLTEVLKEVSDRK